MKRLPDDDLANIVFSDLLAVRIQIHELVRARVEGTGGVHLLDNHTFERRLNLLLDELVRLAVLRGRRQ